MNALTVCAILACSAVSAGADQGKPPYPFSERIKGIEWHWETYKTAAPGSDLWPITWGPDDLLYTAWGDGGGFGGTDSEGRVSLGYGRIEGPPESFRGININGGWAPEHPATFPKKGKTGGLACIDGTLFSTVNLQDGAWPDVNHALEWSTDRGATWTKAGWLFPKGADNFQPSRFVQFGKDYSGLPSRLAGYVYLFGPKKTAVGDDEFYLARAARDKLRDRAAYEYFSGLGDHELSTWTADFRAARPIFTDPRGATPSGMVYDPSLKLFLLSSFHAGPCELGVFAAPDPWGPWKTLAYYDHWGQMTSEGEGLTCEFPQKWMSSDGLTLWCVFSAYGKGAKQGIQAHDRLNLVKVTLTPAK